MEERRVSGGGGVGGDGDAPRPPRRREVRVLEDAVELTRAAAAEVVGALAMHREAAAAAAPFPSIALAGGSTPRALYRLLTDPAAPFRARVDWEAVQFFWGDERHVPPDHPDSNYRMAREAMLDHLQVPAAHVHRIAGEEPDAARAARFYERELIEVFGLRRERGNGEGAAGDEAAASDASGVSVGGVSVGGASAGGASAGGASDADAARDAAAAGEAAREWPRFALMLLGLGEEGHTASLFPGSPWLADGELSRPAGPAREAAGAQEPWMGGPARRPETRRRPRRPRRLVASVWVEKLRTWRITLTPAAINHAATVIFLVSGGAKAAALAAVLEGEWRPELYPAQVVAPVDGRLLWLVDRAAAAQLRSSSRG